MNKAEIIREFIDVIWNKKQIEKVPNYINQEYKIHLDAEDPWECTTLFHSDYIDRLEHTFSSFPDAHFVINKLYEEKNHVGITWTLTGTNTGSIREFPPTYKKIKADGMTIYHFKDSLICAHTQIFDRRTIISQLGF